MTDTGDTTFERTPTGIAIRTTITVADNPQPGTLGAALAALDGCGEALREALAELRAQAAVIEAARQIVANLSDNLCTYVEMDGSAQHMYYELDPEEIDPLVNAVRAWEADR